MNITVRQIEFKSTNGTDTIFGWMYMPSDCRGVVQVVHGMAEHMGRYHEFMRFLAQNGYAACGIDQIGHGRSAGEGKYGYIAKQDGWKRLVEDQYKFHKIIDSELPGKANVMLGHSMGSLVSRIYVSKYPQAADGLIVIGTARGGLRVELAMAMAASSIKKNGEMYRDRKLHQLIFGRYNERVKPSKSGDDWLSRDAEQVKRYADDPACGFIFTASGFHDLFKITQAANEQVCFASTPKELPIILLSGMMDPVGEYGKGVRQVCDRYVKAGVADVELALYEGARHELLAENNKTQVWDEVLDWLSDHFDSADDEN